MTEYSIEPELLRTAPRPVRLRSGRARPLKAKIVVVLAMAAFGSITLYLLGSAVVSSVALCCGDERPGLISERHTSSGRGGTLYHLDYKYDLGGATYTDSIQVPLREYETVPPGTAVRVKMLSWMPRYSSQPLLPGSGAGVAKHNISSEAFAGIVTSIAAVIIPYLVYLRPRRRRRLVSSGTPVRGRIAELKRYDNADVKQREGKQSSATYTCRYEYAAANASSEPTISKWIAIDDEREAQRVGVGDAVTVLYDPRHPKRSVVYRFAEYEVAT